MDARENAACRRVDRDLRLPMRTVEDENAQNT
jgi:hypothetical protein